MKKPSHRIRAASIGADEILPEYDFSGARPNKYAARYAQSRNIVRLDPDVAAVFRSPAEVNDALRALTRIIHKHGTRRNG